MTSLRLLAVLAVLSSTPARAKRLAPRPDGPLAHFASPRGKKCRPGFPTPCRHARQAGAAKKRLKGFSTSSRRATFSCAHQGYFSDCADTKRSRHQTLDCVVGLLIEPRVAIESMVRRTPKPRGAAFQVRGSCLQLMHSSTHKPHPERAYATALRIFCCRME